MFLSWLLIVVISGDCEGSQNRAEVPSDNRNPAVTAKAVAAWTDMATDQNPSRRSDAAFMLGQIGPSAKSAMPVLTKLLSDNDAKVRECAAYAIGRIGPEAKDAVPSLIKLLDDEENVIRRVAMHSLGRIGPPAKSAAAVLSSKCLHDKDRQVRVQAALTLGMIDADPKVAVPALMEALSDDSLRSFAVIALGNMGSGARPAASALGSLLTGPDKGLQLEAAEALWKIDPTVRARPIRVIAELLKDKEFMIRKKAADALGRIGPEAAGALPDLAQLLHDPMQDVRDAGAEAIRKVQK